MADLPILPLVILQCFSSLFDYQGKPVTQEPSKRLRKSGGGGFFSLYIIYALIQCKDVQTWTSKREKSPD